MRPDSVPSMMHIPVQSPPVERNLVNTGAVGSSDGIQPSQDVCADLRGLAQQICYATVYDVPT